MEARVCEQLVKGVRDGAVVENETWDISVASRVINHSAVKQHNVILRGLLIIGPSVSGEIMIIMLSFIVAIIVATTVIIISDKMFTVAA